MLSKNQKSKQIVFVKECQQIRFGHWDVEMWHGLTTWQKLVPATCYPKVILPASR